MPALLEATTAQIDWTVGTIDLNPAGRDPTDKRRPVLRVFDMLRPWLEGLPKGHLIRYRGKPIAEADIAFKARVRRAKIEKKANPYSAWHSLGRWFRQAGIDTEEIGVFFGQREDHGRVGHDLDLQPVGPRVSGQLPAGCRSVHSRDRRPHCEVESLAAL